MIGMRKSTLIKAALYGVGGMICLLAGTHLIGQATTETMQTFIGVGSVLVGGLCLYRAISFVLLEMKHN